jgi:hypothetical protein
MGQPRSKPWPRPVPPPSRARPCRAPKWSGRPPARPADAWTWNVIVAHPTGGHDHGSLLRIPGIQTKKLEAQGTDVDTILDACFTIAVQGAIRSARRQAAARTLLEIAIRTADPDEERTEWERSIDGCCSALVGASLIPAASIHASGCGCARNASSDALSASRGRDIERAEIHAKRTKESWSSLCCCKRQRTGFRRASSRSSMSWIRTTGKLTTTSAALSCSMPEGQHFSI